MIVEIIGKQHRISIHAPREGGDLHIAGMMTMKLIFQSTPPARGATGRQGRALSLIRISIHAPREGGDTPLRFRIMLPIRFQSTPPARGATTSL